MQRILHFGELVGQYRLFEIPIRVQINCSRFVEHILDKSC